MYPNNPNIIYTHKKSKRKFRVVGIEKLVSTQTYFEANKPKKYKGKFYTFSESDYKTRDVLTVQYLDNKKYEHWLIDFDYSFIKIVNPPLVKDENYDKTRRTI